MFFYSYSIYLFYTFLTGDFEIDLDEDFFKNSSSSLSLIFLGVTNRYNIFSIISWLASVFWDLGVISKLTCFFGDAIRFNKSLTT